VASSVRGDRFEEEKVSGHAVLPDEEVVGRVRAGDRAQFEVLMRRYNQRLYRIVRSILRDEAETEDVLQQTYLNAYTHLDQFARRASFATWLTRIAVHEALARRQRQAAALPRAGDAAVIAALPSSFPDPEREALTAELKGLLEASIDALPDTYRCVFVMREVEGLSTAETAAGLTISEDVVKTRLHRARAMLRDAILRRVGRCGRELFVFGFGRCDALVRSVLAALRQPVWLAGLSSEETAARG
jgi:RNA polymerase sigma-70 factor (ECF subfamily)